MFIMFLKDSPSVSHEDQRNREGLDEEPRTPAYQHVQPRQPRVVAATVLTQQASLQGVDFRVCPRSSQHGVLRASSVSSHQLLGLNMAGANCTTCKDPSILQL